MALYLSQQFDLRLGVEGRREAVGSGQSALRTDWALARAT